MLLLLVWSCLLCEEVFDLYGSVANPYGLEVSLSTLVYEGTVVVLTSPAEVVQDEADW